MTNEISTENQKIMTENGEFCENAPYNGNRNT